MNRDELSVGRIATLACLLEVAAPKPGNVHRGADFEDATLEDFMTSAVVLGQVIDDSDSAPVGETILSAVQATKSATGTNTNLGMILLIVPLAKATQWNAGSLTPTTVEKILANSHPDDTRQVFQAIRLARPGGLGSAELADVNDIHGSTGIGLLEAMQVAADRDLIARQYVNQFEQVFEFGVPELERARTVFTRLSEVIVYTHIATMAEFPDSLIARKCGPEIALHSQFLARRTLDELGLGLPERSQQAKSNYWERASQLDFWLRSDGHRRNPGTSADLVAASLFVALQTGKIEIG